jgi:hypothetical protein
MSSRGAPAVAKGDCAVESSPLDGRGDVTRPRESTPHEADDGEIQKASAQPEEERASREPRGGGHATATASNDVARNSRTESHAPARDPVADSVDRWGDLPMHARDVFRTHGGADLPAYYRDWIDHYYRRLNASR